MRLRKEMIHYISEVIVSNLIAEKSVDLKGTKEAIVKRINKVITDDLAIEDKLNEEVKEIMSSYANQISKGNVDYGKMFLMIKNKLAKDRKLVL